VSAQREWEDALRGWVNGQENFQQSGLVCVSIEGDTSRFSLEPGGWVLNPNGAVRGAQLMAAVDQCMGVAASSDTHGAVTATLHAQFIRPAFPPVTLEAVITRRGNTVVFVSVDVCDRDERLCLRCAGSMAPRPDVVPLVHRRP
jgi:acyl-coenzyme A thioesterase PaaI-like protein